MVAGPRKDARILMILFFGGIAGTIEKFYEGVKEAIVHATPRQLSVQ